jgi:hypothetical protein
MAYFMKIQYMATGEGVSHYYVFATVESKEALYDKCLDEGIHSYFLQCAEFFHVDDITEEDLNLIQVTVPRMYAMIKNKVYEKGNIWIRYDDHLNFS